MEFERAILRVYERCVEGLRDDDNEDDRSAINSKSCRFIETITFVLSTFFLFTLIYLHVTFVGQKGCLPNLLSYSNGSYLQDDYILQITLDNSFATDNTGVRNVNKASDDQIERLRRPRRNLLLQQSDMNQPATKLVYNRDQIAAGPLRFQKVLGFNSIFAWNGLSSSNITAPSNSSNSNHSVIRNNSITKDKGEYYDYMFSFHVAELFLPTKIRKDHGFKVVNITMSAGECFGSPLANYLLPLGGLDTVVINNLMFTFQKPGFVLTSDGEYYDWNKKDLQPHDTVWDWISFKLSVLLLSLLSFALLSTATALLVRILISSGVVLLLPLFYSLQLCGVRVITNQIIRLSYPWIGIPLEMLRSRRQSVVPFLVAHITRVVIYYIFYQACQIAFANWFYSQQQPGQRELWLFAIMMLWEYYSMIYVRTRNSIHLFPRVSLALYLMYHFYLYSNPFGFHVLALLVIFLYSSCAMTYCVRKYELQAFYRGVVNIDRPRMMHNTVPWPTWSMSLAPDFTLFLPVTEHATDIYNHPVPHRDVELGGAAAAAGASNGDAAATAVSPSSSSFPSSDLLNSEVNRNGDANARSEGSVSLLPSVPWRAMQQSSSASANASSSSHPNYSPIQNQGSDQS